MKPNEEVEREALLPAPPAAVWEALTDSRQLSAWFGARVEMDPRRGGRVASYSPEGRVRGGVIEVFEPERLLVFRWLPFDHDPSGRVRPRPPARVRLALREASGGTLLSVSESVPGEASAAPHLPGGPGMSLGAEAGR